MADQRTADLANQAKKVIAVYERLNKPPYGRASRELQDWMALFEQAREAYPKSKNVMGARNNPLELDDWVNEQAAGKAPRPNADDLAKMEEAEKRAPAGADSAFWRRWTRIVAFADGILADGRFMGGVSQMTGALPVAPSPASSASAASASEPRKPRDHRPEFNALTDAFTRASQRRRDLIQQLAAAQASAEQLARDEEALRAALAPVAESEWITIGEYQETRNAYDGLTAVATQFSEEKQRLAGVAAEAERTRREARTLVIERLIALIRKMWSQYSLHIESEGSDHERSVAIQAVNDIGAILHDVYQVDWLQIHSDERMDTASMTQKLTRKTKDKDRVGTVAAVLIPGFRDHATGKVYRAEVEVYAG